MLTTMTRAYHYPGAQPPGWVSVPGAKIINLVILATDHHYPGDLSPGWVGFDLAGMKGGVPGLLAQRI
jgi:hypothetical protein